MEVITVVAAVIAAIAAVAALIVALKKQKAPGQNTDLDPVLREIGAEGARVRSHAETVNKITTETLYAGVRETNQQVLGTVKAMSEHSAGRIAEMKEELSKSLAEMRVNIKGSLDEVRADNAKQLDEMRKVVDEKLSATLSERLNQSFGVISERLEAVAKNLGEIKSLDNGINDLKRVLTNVKTRGTWGEVSLEALLSELLTPDQYARSVCVKKGSAERVDFAVLLPEDVCLPIDVKFPAEDYLRLSEALEHADRSGYDEARKALAARIRQEARSISSKYVNPPRTTDFAVMYLPVEGLYAEVLRMDGLMETLQKEYKVIPAGPTNFAALLNSLRMGFRTLTIQKYSREVFDLFQKFTKDFDTFSDLIVKAQSQVESVNKTLESAGHRTRQIRKKLDRVGNIAMPEEEGAPGLPVGSED